MVCFYANLAAPCLLSCVRTCVFFPCMFLPCPSSPSVVCLEKIIQISWLLGYYFSHWNIPLFSYSNSSFKPSEHSLCLYSWTVSIVVKHQYIMYRPKYLFHLYFCSVWSHLHVWYRHLFLSWSAAHFIALWWACTLLDFLLLSA